jgi:hypothetical protein
MPRHAGFIPHGVIPAVLLPFNEDFSIDEASYRAHLRDVTSVKGISGFMQFRRAKAGAGNHPGRGW